MKILKILNIPLSNKSYEEKKLIIKNELYCLARYFELLLALLRTRKSTNELIKNIFCNGSEMNSKFSKLITGSISEFIISNNLEMKIFVRLNVEKPDSFKKLPDILYALRLYLLGEEGAQNITITEISGDDEEDDN